MRHAHRRVVERRPEPRLTRGQGDSVPIEQCFLVISDHVPPPKRAASQFAKHTQRSFPVSSPGRCSLTIHKRVAGEPRLSQRVAETYQPLGCPLATPVQELVSRSTCERY